MEIGPLSINVKKRAKKHSFEVKIRFTAFLILQKKYFYLSNVDKNTLIRVDSRLFLTKFLNILTFTQKY